MPSSDVAVFGSSEPRSGDPLYERAYRVGGLLGRAAYRVVTGGYGGVMEAASRGATDAGGLTLGVTCETFAPRKPNAYLTHEIRTADLFERTRELVQRSQAFVVLPGKAGTLAELAFLWALHRAGCLERRPVILLGEDWRKLTRDLEQRGLLDPQQLEITHAVDSDDELMTILTHHVPAKDARP